MSEPHLKPAVTPETWQKIITFGDVRRYEAGVGPDDDVCSYLIALNNYALGDKNPRKITHDQLAVLRQFKKKVNESNMAASANILELDRLIDTIQSILPPVDASASEIVAAAPE